jgi:hypothetical protein
VSSNDVIFKYYTDIELSMITKSHKSTTNNENKRKFEKSAVFSNGKVCMTYDMPISNLIDKNNLKKCVISSFVFSQEWVFSLLPQDIPICLILHEKSAKKRIEKPDENLLIINPPLSGWGVMVLLIIMF